MSLTMSVFGPCGPHDKTGNVVSYNINKVTTYLIYKIIMIIM